MWLRWLHLGDIAIWTLVESMEEEVRQERKACRVIGSQPLRPPFAGNLWQQHLEKVVKSLGGEPIPSFPSNFVFRRTSNGQHTLLLNIYVDDCTLAGGTAEIQQKFWGELRQKVKLEPEEFISNHGTKILGRLHSLNRNPNQITMTYDMRSFTQGIIDLYCELTGTPVDKLRQAITPCLPESSMTDTDFETEGILHKHAARILMRCLWLSRLSRPDISFAVGRLTTRASKWTAWEDRQTLRLISYLNSTKGHMMRAAVEPKAKTGAFGIHRFRFCVMSVYKSQHIWNYLCHADWWIKFSNPLVMEETGFNRTFNNGSGANCRGIVWGGSKPPHYGRACQWTSDSHQIWAG